MTGIEARSVNRLYLLAREICVGRDLNDAINRRYSLGPTGTGGRLENPVMVQRPMAETSTVAAIAKLTCLRMAASCCPLDARRAYMSDRSQ